MLRHLKKYSKHPLLPHLKKYTKSKYYIPDIQNIFEYLGAFKMRLTIINASHLAGKPESYEAGMLGGQEAGMRNCKLHLRRTDLLLSKFFRVRILSFQASWPSSFLAS